MKPSRDELRGSLERYLETDLLMGVDAAPLRGPAGQPSARGGASGSRPTNRPAAVPAAGRSAKTTPPPRPQNVPVTQAISPEELASREQALKTLDEGQVKGCVKCRLSQSRTQTVFGQGSAAARLLFIGEGPGADEDAQGLAFIGRAGQLLTKMVEAMGLKREEVFICNIVKCRPPENRVPAPDEVAACWPYLDEQLRTIQPEVIVTLGKPATQTLLRTTEGIGRLRGSWHEYFVSGSAMVGPPTPLMPTYHPAYLLRNPPDKGKAWSDLKMVMTRLGLPIP
jgi:uracil-DNA glycosylase